MEDEGWSLLCANNIVYMLCFFLGLYLLLIEIMFPSGMLRGMAVHTFNLLPVFCTTLNKLYHLATMLVFGFD